MKKIILIAALSLTYAVFTLNVCNAQVNPSSPDYQSLKSSGSLPTLPQVHYNGPITTIVPSQAQRTASCLLTPLDVSTYSYLDRNDDYSTTQIFFPFNFDFYGRIQTSCWINNNGNVSFDGPYSTYSATGFPITGFPMLAPFWADVDTRNALSGLMWYKVEAHRVIIIWDSVGYFSAQADKRNTFELIFTDGTDPLVGVGNNVAFSYDDMQWTTGSASGGVNGFGGIPATVGVNNGDGTLFALIGRFDHEGIDYDGPGGIADGVSYLDCKNFFFNTSTNSNIPPVASGFPPSPVTINVGDVWNYSVQFLSPEIGQTTTTVVNDGGLSDFTYSTTSGSVSQIDMQLTGTNANLGSHTVVFTATDDGIPVGVTTVYLEFNVVQSECTNPTSGGEIGNAQNNCFSFDPEAITSVSLPVGYTGMLEYKWQYSTDNTTFFDIANSNSETYDPELITQTTWYKRLVRVDCMPDWASAVESNVVEMTIEDNEAPTFTCPGDIVLCYQDAAFQVNTLPFEPPADNCGIASFTNDQPEVFPVGATTVTWTATDLSGNITSCSMVVTLNPPIEASISQSYMPEFCQGEFIILSADVTGSDVDSYLWSTGEVTESIEAGTSGTYSVTVTNALGCEAFASIDLSINITDLLSSYVMLTNSEIKLEGTTVYDGGLGVKNCRDGKIEANSHSLVNDAGTFAKAHSIHVDHNSTIAHKYFSPATVAWPAFESMNCNGSIMLNIPNNTTFTVNGALYREIKVGKNATAIFTQPIVNIGKIRMEDGATLKFMQCTKVHLKYGLESKKNITINPDELPVVFFIDDDVEFMEGAFVTGVLYLGNSHCDEHRDHDLHVNSSKSSHPGIFRGMFLAESIQSGKNTSWHMTTACFNCAPVVLKNSIAEIAMPVLESGTILKNYPNPFNTTTTFVFMLPDDNHVKLNVFDLSGKLVKTVYNAGVAGGQTYTVEFDGSALPAGMYVYKMTTNNDVITGKMIINR